MTNVPSTGGQHRQGYLPGPGRRLNPLRLLVRAVIRVLT